MEYILLFDSSFSDEEVMKTRRETKSCFKRRDRLGYLTDLAQELKMEDIQGFKEMLTMSYEEFKMLLNSREQHITPHQVNSGNKVITAKDWPLIAIPSNR